MTIIVSEIIESGIDITMAIVVVPCNICGVPARGQRFSFARDADFVGKLVHFSCAASKINR